MAWVALATGDAGEAEHLLDEAVRVLQPSAPWYRLLALYVRAILAVRRGNPDEAIGFVHESLLEVRVLHDKFAFVYALVPLAAAAVLKGDDDALYVEALKASMPMYSPDGRMSAEGAEVVRTLLAGSLEKVRTATIDLSKTFTNEFIHGR